MNEYDLLGLILPDLEKLSSYVMRPRLWEGAVGNTIPAALSRATLLNTELSAVLYGETKMPDDYDGLFERMDNVIRFRQNEEVEMPNEVDEAQKFLREYKKARRKMPDKGNEKFLERMIRDDVARWKGSSMWTAVSGTEYVRIELSSGSTSNNRIPTYEESHDLKNYKCDLCGRGPVQLWREGKKNYDPPPRILCIWCVGDVMRRNYRGQLEDVEIIIESSFVGWVPAIPYNDHGEYLLIPPNTNDYERYGINWWLGLKR